MEHVVLALEALHDDAARARVLHLACSHFRIGLPASSPAPAPETAPLGAASAQQAAPAVEFPAAAADQAGENEIPEDFRLWLNASRI